jgi:hypothetical protein
LTWKELNNEIFFFEKKKFEQKKRKGTYKELSQQLFIDKMDLKKKIEDGYHKTKSFFLSKEKLKNLSPFMQLNPKEKKIFSFLFDFLSLNETKAQKAWKIIGEIIQMEEDVANEMPSLNTSVGVKINKI